MHALILSLLLAGSAHAEKLLLEVKDGKTWTKLYENGKDWRCATDLTKHFYIEKRPKALSMLPLRPPSESSCEKKISIVVHEPKKIWIGCSTDPAVEEFRRQLARDCGR